MHTRPGAKTPSVRHGRGRGHSQPPAEPEPLWAPSAASRPAHTSPARTAPVRTGSGPWRVAAWSRWRPRQRGWRWWWWWWCWRRRCPLGLNRLRRTAKPAARATGHNKRASVDLVVHYHHRCRWVVCVPRAGIPSYPRPHHGHLRVNKIRDSDTVSPRPHHSRPWHPFLPPAAHQGNMHGRCRHSCGDGVPQGRSGSRTPQASRARALEHPMQRPQPQRPSPITLPCG